MMYEIRPLEWNKKDHRRWCANSAFGEITVYRGWDKKFAWHFPCTYCPEDCDSIEDGKAKAEAYYRERLLAALVPVPESQSSSSLRPQPMMPHDKPKPANSHEKTPDESRCKPAK